MLYLNSDTDAAEFRYDSQGKTFRDVASRTRDWCDSAISSFLGSGSLSS